MREYLQIEVGVPYEIQKNVRFGRWSSRINTSFKNRVRDILKKAGFKIEGIGFTRSTETLPTPKEKTAQREAEKKRQQKLSASFKKFKVNMIRSAAAAASASGSPDCFGRIPSNSAPECQRCCSSRDCRIVHRQVLGIQRDGEGRKETRIKRAIDVYIKNIA